MVGYSWKAITCCVSKSLLIMLAMACTIGGCIGGFSYADKRHDAHCRALYGEAVMAKDAGNDAQSDLFLERYVKDCETESWKSREISDTAKTVVISLCAFGIGLLFLFAICSANITYCQVAVETRRKPWYWLPAWAGGDPLPGREIAICEHCKHGEPETDAQYRARVLGKS
jgi:hypothetical protein